ncbi:hypothetical protein Tco_0380916 [Tanacetum coccineum]
MYLHHEEKATGFLRKLGRLDERLGVTYGYGMRLRVAVSTTDIRVVLYQYLYLRSQNPGFGLIPVLYFVIVRCVLIDHTIIVAYYCGSIRVCHGKGSFEQPTSSRLKKTTGGEPEGYVDNDLGANRQHDGNHRPYSFASFLHEESSRRKVNIRTLEAEKTDLADALILMLSVLEV